MKKKGEFKAQQARNKERQGLFDAIKLANSGEVNVCVNYLGTRYRISSTDTEDVFKNSHPQNVGLYHKPTYYDCGRCFVKTKSGLMPGELNGKDGWRFYPDSDRNKPHFINAADLMCWIEEEHRLNQ